MKKDAQTRRYSYTVRGKKYASLREIAKDEGVTEERIRQKMNDPSYAEYQRFFPDGSPAPKSKPTIRRKHAKSEEKSCTINGIEYESQKIAAEDLGLSAGNLQYRLKSSNFPEYTSTHHEKMRVAKRGGCSVAGVEYKSIQSATTALGISRYEMDYRLASLDYPDYVSPHITKKPNKIRRYKKKGA